MTKVTLDMTRLKNEVSQLHNLAYAGVGQLTDNERREVLLKVIEGLKALKTNMGHDAVTVEVK